MDIDATLKLKRWQEPPLIHKQFSVLCSVNSTCLLTKKKTYPKPTPLSPPKKKNQPKQSKTKQTPETTQQENTQDFLNNYKNVKTLKL